MKRILNLVILLGVFLSILGSASYAIPTLLPGDSWCQEDVDKSTITKINIVDSYTATGEEDKSWEAHVTDTGTIMCYINGTELTIAGDGTDGIQANADSSNLFADFVNVQEIDGLELLDTTDVTNMSGMFNSCSAVINLNVSGFNTTNVTNMSGMFNGCSAVIELDVSQFDTTNVTNMSGMFNGCSAVTELDVSLFDTTKVTNMSGMFNGCSSVTELDVSLFKTTNVTTMLGMFYNCSSLTSLNLTNFDTAKVTSMQNMFGKCTNLQNLDLSSFDTAEVTDMNSMFMSCTSLKTITFSDKFDTSGVIAMHNMFASCSSIIELDVSGFATPAVVQMYNMFKGCSSVTSLDLSNFDTTNVSNLNNMFQNMTSLSEITLGANFSFGSGSTTTSCVLPNEYWYTANGTQLTVDEIAENHNALTTYYAEDPRFKATLNAEVGGTISPTGIVPIATGEEVVVTITADENYHIYEILVDEQTVELTDRHSVQYTLRDLTQDTEINARFERCSGGNAGVDIRPSCVICGEVYGNPYGYTISYDANGGIDAPESETKIHGENYTISSMVPTREDYEFIEWNTQSNGSGDSYVPSELYSEDQAVTFYAIWQLEPRAVAIYSADDQSLTFTYIRDDVTVGGTYDGKTVTEIYRGILTDSYGSENSVPWNSYRGSIKKVLINKEPIAPASTAFWFAGFTSLQTIDLMKLDTTETTDMHGMFRSCSGIANLDLRNLITSNVTNMSYMFEQSQFTNIDVSMFDTGKVTNMSYMFSKCTKLTSIDVSNFDTSEVTDMSGMFKDSTKLTSIDLTNFNTSKVTNMSYMFYGCTGLTSVDLTSFDTSKVTRMSGMFYNCAEIKELDISNFNTDEVSYISDMFTGMNKLHTVKLGSNFSFKGNGTVNCELPTPSSTYIPNADGKWRTLYGVEYEPQSMPDNTEETYYAVKPFIVSFDANGGTGEMEDLIFDNVSELPLPKNKFSRSRYSFLGWSTTENGIVEIENEELFAPTSDTTLYAVWKKRPSDSGSSSIGSSSSSKKEETTKQEEITKDEEISKTEEQKEEEQKIKEYIIKISANDGGIVSPTAEVTVVAGNNQQIDIKPNDGFEVYDVLVDGSSIGSVTTYTFSNVDESHNIEVIFKEMQEELPKVKRNMILVVGKVDSFEEICLPLDVLLKIYNINGSIIYSNNKATYTSNGLNIVFENDKQNISVNNESNMLLRAAKIINNTVYITLSDFLNLL